MSLFQGKISDNHTNRRRVKMTPRDDFPREKYTIRKKPKRTIYYLITPVGRSLINKVNYNSLHVQGRFIYILESGFT